MCCGVAAPTPRIVRCGLTGQKSAEVVVPARDRVIGREGPNVEVYFEEDKCGLLFLEAHRHLKRLTEITAQATDPASLRHLRS